MVEAEYIDGFVIFRPMVVAPSSRAGLRSWRRRAIALLGALVVVVGAADFHSLFDAAGEDHHGAASWTFASGSMFFPEAAHPDQPLHAEAAHAQEVRSCVVCLERLGYSATPTSKAVGLAVEPPQRSTPTIRSQPARRGEYRPVAGRGPPYS